MIIANRIVIEDNCTIKVKRLTRSEYDLLTRAKKVRKESVATMPSDKSALFKDDSGWVFIGVE